MRKRARKLNQELVSDFMGLPPADETMFLSDADSISSVIDKIWDDWSIGSENSPEQCISQNWNKIVGLKLSSRCAPEKIDKTGKLFIRAANGPVRQELSFRKKHLLDQIRKLEGCEIVKDLRIV